MAGEKDSAREEARRAKGARPAGVIVCAWLAAIGVSLWGARDLHQAIAHDDRLSRHEWLVAAASGARGFSRWAGLSGARDVLEASLGALKQRRAAVASEQPRPEPKAPAPAPPEVQAPVAFRGKEVKETRVLIVGASSIQYYLGVELERRLESFRGVKVHRDGRLSTGLTRPDVLDWPAHVGELLAELRPQVVIGQFGGNDAQPIELPDGKVVAFGHEAWSPEYARRVEDLVRKIQAGGARAVLLGMPIVRDPAFAGRLARVNRVTQEATEAAGGVYLSTWELAADEKGEYRAEISDGGKTGPMYLPDGVHYSRLGAKVVARRLGWRLQRYLDLTPSDESLATALRYEFDSRARRERTSYLAFVPQRALREDTRLPLLLLLHGAGGDWTDFSEHDHELLQKLATKHSVVLVTPDGGKDGWYVDSPKLETSQIETYFMTELLAHVAANLPVTERRGIAGISMGGNGAIAFSLKHPGAFASASSLSGTVDLSRAATRQALIERLGPYEENREEWERNSAAHLVRTKAEVARRIPLLLTVGSGDRWAAPNREFTALLSELGVEHEFKELPGEHAWTHWLRVLPTHVAWHAPRLSEPGKAAAPAGSSVE